ncbi:heavy-metal-associated domain-containing protein [Pseudomonas lopnurensis]|uniref:heavy-metal-associated domain-containing protein n=1 Tax=Pseudomonas lopnurensis TaxID=1477517 RepID=UPI001879B6DD|nr:heavy metal-associated domain-containing protein [Pseudomonas lopnurensis]MBE7376755.1 heavy-metal-associated domain-containing protein [Pseudomonas lopnurensis]
MNTSTLKVSGMNCGACVRHVNAALQPLAGVERVDVDLAAGLVRIVGTADGPALIAALDGAGYPAEAVTDSPAAEARKTGCGGSAGCCCN